MDSRIATGIRGIFGALMLVTLAACNGGDGSADSTKAPAAEQPTTGVRPTAPSAPTDPVEEPTPTTPVTPTQPTNPSGPTDPTPPIVVPTDPTPPQEPPVPSDGNAAPQIQGAPATQAPVGKTFNFQPTATDADGDTLTFSISSKPEWASFNAQTGRLSGMPKTQDVGSHEDIKISVSDGAHTKSLPEFAVNVVSEGRKSNFGHYFATRYSDKPADAAMLCEQKGVTGINYRRTWKEVEGTEGRYDFSAFDQVFDAIARSKNPNCQVWIMIEWKSFDNSPVQNPCPDYLSAYSAPSAGRTGARTCFMWEPKVVARYIALIKAAAARYDSNPRMEGLILEESSLGFNGAASQDKANGGTYTAEAWRDALVDMITECGAAFAHSHCMAFLNFLHGGQQYLHDISEAISSVPGNGACFSGPDLLPNNSSLFNSNNSVYEVLIRHNGCRSNSAQNDSYQVPGCSMDCIFKFAVSGTFGDFRETAPSASGVCVNSYLFWNHRVGKSQTGLDWQDALPTIAANPYGAGWTGKCSNGGGTP